MHDQTDGVRRSDDRYRQTDTQTGRQPDNQIHTFTLYISYVCTTALWHIDPCMKACSPKTIASVHLQETVPFVFDHRWTQGSPIFPLTFGGKAGPYIDQWGWKLKVQTCQKTSKFWISVSRLLELVLGRKFHVESEFDHRTVHPAFCLAQTSIVLIHSVCAPHAVWSRSLYLFELQ